MSPRPKDLSARFGVSRREITPPLTINARSWGASAHDQACGVHQPLTCTALVIEPEGGPKPLFLFSLDLGWWRTREDEWFVRGFLLEELQIPENQLLLALTHTHAGPNLDTAHQDSNARAETALYLESLRRTCLETARRAQQNARPAFLTWGAGACSLAQNREWYDPIEKRYVCGWNPHHSTQESRVSLGTVREKNGKILATLIHYACHPTSLGPDNTLLSPDFIGPMRNLIEPATDGAPCLFLQGASGDLAPAEQYSAEVAVAERNGRQLGYAALSVLARFQPPGTELNYVGILESGASLGIWRPVETEVRQDVEVQSFSVELPLRGNHAKQSEIERLLVSTTVGFQKERLRRQLGVCSMWGNETIAKTKIWLWKLGGIWLLAHPFEAYSQVQFDLDRAFPDQFILGVNIVNGWLGYLPPQHLYDEDIYSVWQTPFERGGMEAFVRVCEQKLIKK